MEVSARRGRLQTEDLLYLIRNVRACVRACVRVGCFVFLFSRRHLLPETDSLFLCFFFQDEKKVQRVNELLDMNVQLKEARKNFDLNDTTNVP